MAVPSIGPTALATVPFARSMSSMPAPTAPAAAPVDSPCTTRAATSAPTPWAVAKITMATAWVSVAAISTGRRPTWSDSEPNTSNAASTAKA